MFWRGSGAGGMDTTASDVQPEITNSDAIAAIIFISIDPFCVFVRKAS
jgi:hypothetical protein